MSSMDQAAEADLLDQQHAVEEADEILIPHPATALEEASEGDLLEQEQSVTGDDDLYPYGAEEE
ncbi:hypothetical protein [Nocardioides insulae]|uniref:hypothetical protein n=1 Tax=Nocardioides insulae TaxID=394734 RepID=UPI0012F898C3|nr:hypothetical protein [Nocardioides insulae]